MKLKVDEDNGYPLHEWIRHDIENNLEVKIEKTTSELNEANSNVIRLRSELTGLSNLKDALELSIKYFLERK